MPSLSKKSLLLRLSFWNFLLCDFPRLFRTGCHDLRGGRPGGVSAAPCGLRVSSESSQRAGGVACRAGQLFPVGLPEVRSHHRPETPHTPSCGIGSTGIARGCVPVGQDSGLAGGGVGTPSVGEPISIQLLSFSPCIFVRFVRTANAMSTVCLTSLKAAVLKLFGSWNPLHS